MRGYVVLTLIAALLFLALPPLFLSGTTTPTVTEPTVVDDAFTVLHEDGTTVGRIGAYDLTLYSVIGTVSAEVPPEAIKAQTVALYSLFHYQKTHRAATDKADICDPVLPYPQGFTVAYWQERWGEAYDQRMAVYREAVDAVFGQQLQYENAPAMALYHTMNGGKTENADVLFKAGVPYLRSVASPADMLDERQLTTVTLPASQVAPVLKSLCGTDAIGIAETWFGEAQKTDAGTVATIVVAGKTLSGVALQEAFSLPSAAFEVCVQEEQVIFTVRGHGHFVGMSLCGAEGLARNGASYREILAHYYPGTLLTNAVVSDKLGSNNMTISR